MAKNGHRILYTSTYVCNILWLCFCSFKRPLFQLCLEIILSHLLFLEASLNQFCFYIDNLSGLGKPNPKPILRRFRVDSLALERVPRCSSIAIPFCSTLSNTSHMVLGVPPFGAAKFSNLLLCSIAENSSNTSFPWSNCFGLVGLYDAPSLFLPPLHHMVGCVSSTLSTNRAVMPITSSIPNHPLSMSTIFFILPCRLDYSPPISL